MIITLYKIARTSHIAKRIMQFFLSTFLFTHNPFYPYFYMKNARKRISNMQGAPRCVIIENTNLCNLRCIFCFQKDMKREKGCMSIVLFEKIIGECARWGVREVLIQGFGEPLLDPLYIERVKYAKSRGLYVYCATNGLLLDIKKAEGLVRAGLDYISISIDASSAQQYAYIHNTACSSYYSLVTNVLDLAHIKGHPYIQLRCKSFEGNDYCGKKFLRFWKGKTNEAIVYGNIVNWVGSSVENNLPPIKLLKFPCYNLWAALLVLWDGRVVECCQDYEGKHIIGDAKKQSLEEIWQGEELKKNRENHLKRRWEGLCKDCVINTHYLSPWWFS